MSTELGVAGDRAGLQDAGLRLVLTLWLPGSLVYVSSDPPRNNGSLYWSQKTRSNSDPAGSCLPGSSSRSWRQTWWEGGAEEKNQRVLEAGTVFFFCTGILFWRIVSLEENYCCQHSTIHDQ